MAMPRFTDRQRRVRTLRAASELVRRSGIVMMFPSECAALLSLWQAFTGRLEVTVFRVDERGRRVLTPDLQRAWALKNQLGERRRACVGKHIRGRLTLISPEALPLLYALTERPGRPDDFDDTELFPPLHLELARALLQEGPQTGPALRRLVGSRDTRATKRALEVLQRGMVVTQAGEQGQEAGWPAAVFDLVARRYQAQVSRLPALDRALAELAALVLCAAGELSAADTGLALGVSGAAAAAALDRLVEEGRASRRIEGRFALWTPAGA